jgi:uncharacterized protein
MKRVVTILLMPLIVLFIIVLCIGWILGKPVQTKIGTPPRDLNAESVEFRSDSGTTVKGWWSPIEHSQHTILLLPGIRANRLSMPKRARFLRRAGYSTLLIDFQATGQTKGKHITFGWKESRDVLAAVEFIHSLRPADRIGVIGSSLGGAAALLAAPSLKINALVLESVYPTIDTAVQNRVDNYLGPIPSRFISPLLLWQLKPRLGISASDLRPVDHIATVGCPTFVISGESDRHTTRQDTMALYLKAPNPKRLWLVPKAGHVDLHVAATAEYESRVLSFLEEALANDRAE